MSVMFFRFWPNGNFSKNLSEHSQHKISRKSVRWESRYSMRMDVQTDRHLIVFAVAAWKPLEGHVKVMTVVGNPVGIPTRYFTRTSLKKITVCCDVTSCSLLEIVERFGGNCCPCVQDGYHENGGSRFPRKFARFYCSRRVHIPEELIFIVMAMETSNLTILKHNRFDTAFGIWKNT